MLRITVTTIATRSRYSSKGSWRGPGWRCWRNVGRTPWGGQCKSIRCVDLTGVTFIDDAGKACLAAMFRQGASFVAADCMTKSILAEITRSPLSDGNELTTI